MLYRLIRQPCAGFCPVTVLEGCIQILVIVTLVPAAEKGKSIVTLNPKVEIALLALERPKFGLRNSHKNAAKFLPLQEM